MPKWILSWKRLVGYAVLIGLLAAMQGVALAVKRNFSKVYEGNCTLVSEEWEQLGTAGVKMKLDCGEHRAWNVQVPLIVACLNQPDLALNCRVYEDDEAECDSPPPPGVKTNRANKQKQRG